MFMFIFEIFRSYLRTLDYSDLDHRSIVAVIDDLSIKVA